MNSDDDIPDLVPIYGEDESSEGPPPLEEDPGLDALMQRFHAEFPRADPNDEGNENAQEMFDEAVQQLHGGIPPDFMRRMEALRRAFPQDQARVENLGNAIILGGRVVHAENNLPIPIYLGRAFHVDNVNHMDLVNRVRATHQCDNPECTAEGWDINDWPPHQLYHINKEDMAQMVLIKRMVFERRPWDVETVTPCMWDHIVPSSVNGTVIADWRRPIDGTWKPCYEWACMVCVDRFNFHTRHTLARYWITLNTVLRRAAMDEDDTRFRELVGAGATGANACGLWMLPPEMIHKIAAYLEEPAWEALEPCTLCAEGIENLRPCITYHDYTHHLHKHVTCPVLNEFTLTQFEMRETTAHQIRLRFFPGAEDQGHHRDNVFTRHMLDRWQRVDPEDLAEDIQIQGEHAHVRIRRNVPFAANGHGGRLENGRWYWNEQENNNDDDE